MTLPNVDSLRVLAVGILLLLLSSNLVLGQNRSLMDLYKNDSKTIPRTGIARMSQEAEKFTELGAGSSIRVPLEGAVIDSLYIVGPNDQFTITVGGLEPLVTPSLVTADGMLVLPGIGKVAAAGKSLADVKAAALEKLQSSFRNVAVELALTIPREFYVHVTGAVPEPGRYVAMPVARVEDVLKQAFFSRTLETPTANSDYRPALRNVRIKHTDGTEESIDLVRYYRTGDVAWNPFLRDGDAIMVPSFEQGVGTVFVDGDIPFPGSYDFRSGDTVLELVMLASGSLVLEDDVLVQHGRSAAGGMSESTVYTLGDLRNGPPVPVKALDHVHFAESNPTQGLASVEGWVQFPGRYPIIVGETTLQQLVEMAGGIREGALLRGATLQRNVQLVQERRDVLTDLETYERERDLRQGGRWEILTDSSSSLWQMRLGDLNYMSRYFLARWLRMDNRVSADLTTAFESNAQPIYLEDGDKLVVPRDERSVFVIGEVVRPGRVPFSPGAKSSDYVSYAGGSGPEASDTHVIRAGTGQILAANETIYSGDYVFVDRSIGEAANVDAERLRIQLEDQGIRKFQVGLQTVGTLLSIVTTALLIENALGN